MAGKGNFLSAGAANTEDGADELLPENKRNGIMRTQKYTFWN